MDWEPALRLAVFLSVFAAMAVWEWRAPLRPTPRGARWRANLGLITIDTIVLRILFPAAAVGAAIDAANHGWGLFNVVDAPGWLEAVLVIVVLDLAIWAQHVAFHRFGFLWRFHMVHHADEAMDVTTGLRFHPGEIVMSMALKIGLVYALGASVVAVVVFEIALNAASMWSHSNLRLPAGIERLIRYIIVTPDMHRSHHSTDRREHDTNFGFLLSVWDRLFRLYTEAPRLGHQDMEIGLPPWRDGRTARLKWALMAPFRRPE
ncbi:sterol desaturase family protein [Pikeienuella piscinae]|uniref:Sterol desaturase family protein n=1 Tax=Pikeienuella piscinae TaxID=2748098 RepID=A0A7L5BSR4_9RHOB|nr:sterol desaturase family protein [Pikeienuella piscinae]QIE54670.1 sterol desaturase family protein [Pikeienuella piscinae]